MSLFSLCSFFATYSCVEAVLVSIFGQRFGFHIVAKRSLFVFPNQFTRNREYHERVRYTHFYVSFFVAFYLSFLSDNAQVKSDTISMVSINHCCLFAWTSLRKPIELIKKNYSVWWCVFLLPHKPRILVTSFRWPMVELLLYEDSQWKFSRYYESLMIFTTIVFESDTLR